MLSKLLSEKRKAIFQLESLLEDKDEALSTFRSREETKTQIDEDRKIVAQLERDLVNLDAKIKEVESNLKGEK